MKLLQTLSKLLQAIKIIVKKTKKRFGQKANAINESELRIKREIAIMKKCFHPNVVQLFEVIDDPQVNKIYLSKY